MAATITRPPDALQEIQRSMVSTSLRQGMVLKPAVKYQNIAEGKRASRATIMTLRAIPFWLRM